ncbi:kif1 [Symbiodinium necroappetens]|uniref:Kif1 protein n=1 Tax=Symbiodinium necroappetens TaxID=1628268 RepID=A0A812X2V8_9DINO|nr:kif1 [Symbiodinium necroappetens]
MAGRNVPGFGSGSFPKEYKIPAWPNDLSWEESAQLRTIALDGFKRESLNEEYLEGPNAEFKMQGRETYWQASGQYFMYYCQRFRKWRIAEISAFSQNMAGECYAFVSDAHPNRDIQNSSLLKGFIEVENGQWVNREDAGVSKLGRLGDQLDEAPEEAQAEEACEATQEQSEDGETSKCPVMPVVRKARDKVVQAAKEAGKWARRLFPNYLGAPDEEDIAPERQNPLFAGDVPAKGGCNSQTLDGCSFKEQFFIEKQRNASEDQRKSELQRLARMHLGTDRKLSSGSLRPGFEFYKSSRPRMPKASEAELRLSTGARELLGLCERWFMLGLVSQNCPRHLLGTMLGLKNALDGMAGTAAPAVGGMLYYIGRPLPYTVAALFAFAMAVFYISLPPSALAPTGSEELKPLMTPKVKAETEEAEVKAPLHHVQSSALPLSMYAGKHYSSQCLLNQLSLVMDPELRELYNITVDRIEKEKGTVEGTSGIRSVATVCSGLSARTQLNQMNRSLGEVRPMSSDNALAAHLPRRDDDSPDRSMA